MKKVFVGLDGEMSGTNSNYHVLIQIGVALSEDDVFESRIGWSDFQYEADALAAIGVAPENVSDGPPAPEVDRAVVEWLRARKIEPGSLVPIGWGVSDFDRPFIYRALPSLSRYLHHHSVELNAVVYTLAGTRTYLGVDVDFDAWKKMAKRVAEFRLTNHRGKAPKPHDAGDDALLALHSWQWLKKVCAFPSPEVALVDAVDTARTRCEECHCLRETPYNSMHVQ